MRHFKEPNNVIDEYPCGLCNRIIKNEHKSTHCKACNLKYHIKCDKVDPNMYEIIQKESNKEKYICYACREESIPFFCLSEEQFIKTVNKGIDYDVGELSSLNLLPPIAIRSFFNDLNEVNHSKYLDEDETLPINCKYYGVDSLLPKICHNKYFSLFHMNIASLGLHKDELEILLNIVDARFNVIGLTETKIIKDMVPIYDYNIPGYNFFHTPTESTKGGAALYIDNSYVCRTRNDLDSLVYVSEKLESVFVEIIKKDGKNIIIGCIYRHPSMGIEDFNTNYLNNVLNKISTENKNIFLCGDFNIDLMKTGDDVNIDNFMELITSNLLVPHVILPTRITSHSKTLIDNIFSNMTNFNQGISGNFTTSISDHFPQFLFIPMENFKTPKKHNLSKRDYKNFDRVSFIGELININWNEVLSVEKCDPDHSFQMFDSKINTLLNKYAPLKKLNKKDFKNQQKPWITNGILSSIKRRDKLLRKFIGEKELNSKENVHNEYKRLRNNIVALIRISKKNYYTNYFTEHANNIKNTWKGIKSIINIKNCAKSYPEIMKNNGNFFTEPINIAEGFNNYFSTIAENLQEKIVHVGEDFSKYLKNPVKQSFVMESVDSREILLTIELLDDKKASGPYSIPTNILKLIKNNICYPLKEIINLSFATGKYPKNLKIAKVNPIYKGKGDICEFFNYRPISLLSNINKIFEKLVYSRVYSFLNLHNCIYELQFGFRANHSTNHALISLTENIREALDKGYFACGIFVDLQKAFDTVDHTILLDKLKHYGIRGKANEWFKSYLTDRRQHVSINGFVSENKIMNYGVPQGSVLGPLLFLLFIGDLDKEIGEEEGDVLKFVDDTKVVKGVSRSEDVEDLQATMEKIYAWQRRRNMSFNSSKFKILRIGKNEDLKDTTNLFTDGMKEILVGEDYVKDLGILMDKNATFKRHRDEAILKAKRKAGWILRTFSSRAPEILVPLWKSLVQPLMDYCGQLWSPSEEVGALMDQEQVLRGYTRRIGGCYGLNYWERLTKLGLMSTQRRQERYKIIYVWKMMNGLVPDIGIRIKNDCGRSGTRLDVPFMRGAYASHVTLKERSFMIEGPKLFNSLLGPLRSFKGSQALFKTNLDNYLKMILDHPRDEKWMVPEALDHNVKPSNYVREWARCLQFPDFVMVIEEGDSVEVLESESA